MLRNKNVFNCRVNTTFEFVIAVFYSLIFHYIKISGKYFDNNLNFIRKFM